MIHSSELFCSVALVEQLPAESLPEVAFVGRSNSGKSSLLNALCNRRSLARTSKTPGRTQLLHFYQIRSSQGEAFLVDLPGYGYAAVSLKTRRLWESLVYPFLQERRSLRALLLLMDCRRRVDEEERYLGSSISGKELVVVLTKIDKISKSELTVKKAEVAKELGVKPSRIFSVSSTAKGRPGVENLREALLDLLFRVNA